MSGWADILLAQTNDEIELGKPVVKFAGFSAPNPKITIQHAKEDRERFEKLLKELEGEPTTNWRVPVLLEILWRRIDENEVAKVTHAE